MAKFQFKRFNKGWYHTQAALVGLNGFLDVNNFVIHNNAIEKVRGWEFLVLHPEEFSDIVDSFSQIIDDFNIIIDTLNDSALNPLTLAEVTYPLVGPEVQSIFPYIKFEEENIRLGTFGFDILRFFGLVDNFNYVIDFNEVPAIEDGSTIVYIEDSYGLIYTCERECFLHSMEATIGVDPIIAGIAIKIVPDSTKDDATFYGLIYDPFRHQLIFGRWINSSVRTYDQILRVITGVTYAPGTVIRITEVLTNQFKSYVNDVEVFNVIDSVIGIGGTCMGVVKLQTISQAIKIPIDNIVSNGIYFTSRFYVCNDGIIVTENMLPQPDESGDPTTEFVNPFDITIKSGKDGETCFGILRTQVYNNGFDTTPNNKTDYFFADFLYQPISGRPRSGVFLRMDESKADPDDFTGWGIVVDGNFVSIVYWINQTLEHYGTILKVFPRTLIDGEGLSVQYTGLDSNDPAFSNIIVWAIRTNGTYETLGNVQGVDLIIPKGVQLATRQANANIGIGWLGQDAPGEHKARWHDKNGLNEFPDIYVE